MRSPANEEALRCSNEAVLHAMGVVFRYTLEELHAGAPKILAVRRKMINAREALRCANEAVRHAQAVVHRTHAAAWRIIGHHEHACKNSVRYVFCVCVVG